ncbi:MAG: PAC2 family protein [Candidatus Aureabacteria bacterium]|nr:PAC2 family protein [Candidatus Auribacterota bacterium]
MASINGINIFKKPHIKSPIMIAGWPGMGAVATQAIDYVRQQLKAELFAEIDTRDFMQPHSVVVSEGVGKFPNVPRILLFYSEKANLIICEGEEQFSGKSALTIAGRLLELAKNLKVKKIFTGAAFVQHMNHRDKPMVYTVANNQDLREWLVHEKGMKTLKRGQISGLNGSILGFAAQEKIDAACFLSTIPIYAVNLPNPKAAKSIVDEWQKVIGFSVSLKGFDRAIKETDKTLEMVEDQLKKLSFGGIYEDSDDKEENIQTENTNEVPPQIRGKIEHLFESAKKDKRIAHRLKEELDRWMLFKEYEDRFLDLFSDSQ